MRIKNGFQYHEMTNGIRLTPDEASLLKAQLQNLWGGDQSCLVHLQFVWVTFRRWPTIFAWMIRNNITGPRIAEFFKDVNSERGGDATTGYLLGVTRILNRIDGLKHSRRGLRREELRDPGIIDRGLGDV